MLTIYSRDDDMSVWWVDRQSAVALLRSLIVGHYKRTDPDATVTLPIGAARKVLEAAKYGLRKGDRLSAVALLRTLVPRDRNAADPDATITLPLAVALKVLEAANEGLHKGLGQRRPRHSRAVKLREQAIRAWGKERHRQLHEQEGKSNKEVRERAAKEANDLASERYGWRLSDKTIEDWIKRSW